MLGDVKEKNILDYGAGPGVLALALQKLGAKVKAYDINADMRKSAGEKISVGNIYTSVEEIPNDYFDFIIANLVLCIVPEEEVKKIMSNIKNVLGPTVLHLLVFATQKFLMLRNQILIFVFQQAQNMKKITNTKKLKKKVAMKLSKHTVRLNGTKRYLRKWG